MAWMNEYEVGEATARLREQKDEVPNLAQGAWVLNNLVDWTNRNSDGWPYWPKPARAANSLMVMLENRSYAIRFGHDRKGAPLADLTDAELALALRPIKAFLTRQGTDCSVVGL
ncbi:MAG TPA: hypothetical protein VMT27_06640 [Actinomycetes bacterium]|nr:hypothetical protein [Actinomycetes bacterium]